MRRALDLQPRMFRGETVQHRHTIQQRDLAHSQPDNPVGQIRRQEVRRRPRHRRRAQRGVVSRHRCVATHRARADSLPPERVAIRRVDAARPKTSEVRIHLAHGVAAGSLYRSLDVKIVAPRLDRRSRASFERRGMAAGVAVPPVVMMASPMRSALRWPSSRARPRARWRPESHEPFACRRARASAPTT